MNASSPGREAWPVIRTYRGDQLRRIAMPIGGIGTGCVSLGGRGDLRDWEIVNRPAKGFRPAHTFLALWAKRGKSASVTRVLEGPISPHDYEGSSGCPIPGAGLPRFTEAEFDAAYPFGRVRLRDRGVPLRVAIEGFNPLVPADVEASAWPMAVLRVKFHNPGRESVRTSVCASVENFVGRDGKNGRCINNRNDFFEHEGVCGLLLHSDGVPRDAEQWGSLALATTAPARSVTYRQAWANLSWADSLLDFWDDFSADGRLEPREGVGTHNPQASLAISMTVPPGARREVTILLGWHFPNRMTWTPLATPSANAAGPVGPFLVRPDVWGPMHEEKDVGSLAVPGGITGRLRKPEVLNGVFCDVHREIGGHESKTTVTYFRFRFVTPQQMALAALLGYDGPVRVWVDGKEKYTDPVATPPSYQDRASIPFIVDPGEHEIIVALGSAGGLAWGVYLRLQRLDDLSASASMPQYPDEKPSRLSVSQTSTHRCNCDKVGCCDSGPTRDAPDHIGNHYTTRFPDAREVVTAAASRLNDLERRSRRFVQRFAETDLPDVVKEAALFNLSTLRTQTCFQTSDGLFFGWEGCSDDVGCCHGTCTHVWNYEHATGFLFGTLSRSMRAVEFLHATDSRGCMSFRINLPLSRASEHGHAAADGQMGSLVRLYRDWKLSGDIEWLNSLWPAAKRAMRYCWLPGGWDGDGDGVMEGCQHNTMDVDYYGPNPQMQGWYLAALRACEEMARNLEDNDFADECRRLFESGRQWTDRHLFNGQYYEHEIRPVQDGSRLLKGTHAGSDWRTPILQLGAGCLIDQLVGQYAAHLCALGHVLNASHVRKTLQAIVRHNFKPSLRGHFNHMRSYALGGESATLMASYPLGRRPSRPFPYYTEVMTGFEHALATGLMQEGMVSQGVAILTAIRERYDGIRRNPFDEAECGHHYARALAAWSAVIALSGFEYDAPRASMRFAPPAPECPEVNHFWSTGDAWGVARVRRRGKRRLVVSVRVEGGSVRLRVPGKSTMPRSYNSGKTVAWQIVADANLV